jgi:hypothetical protein
MVVTAAAAACLVLLLQRGLVSHLDLANFAQQVAATCAVSCRQGLASPVLVTTAAAAAAAAACPLLLQLDLDHHLGLARTIACAASCKQGSIASLLLTTAAAAAAAACLTATSAVCCNKGSTVSLMLVLRMILRMPQSLLACHTVTG